VPAEFLPGCPAEHSGDHCLVGQRRQPLGQPRELLQFGSEARFLLRPLPRFPLLPLSAFLVGLLSG